MCRQLESFQRNLQSINILLMKKRRNTHTKKAAHKKGSIWCLIQQHPAVAPELLASLQASSFKATEKWRQLHKMTTWGAQPQCELSDTSPRIAGEPHDDDDTSAGCGKVTRRKIDGPPWFSARAQRRARDTCPPHPERYGCNDEVTRNAMLFCGPLAHD